MYNSKVDLTSATCSNPPCHGILLTFNNVTSIAIFKTVNMDTASIHIYVIQAKYTINDRIIFNIKIVALRGRTSAEV